MAKHRAETLGPRESEKKIRLKAGEKYFVPKLGEVLTYYGRAGWERVLVDKYGRRRQRNPHLFGKLGGLFSAAVTDEEARQAVLVKKNR